jgi:putative transposase
LRRFRRPVYGSAVTAYRCNFIAGGSFFFTVNLVDRRSHLLTEQIDLLRQAFRSVRVRHPFKLDAVVIFRDHLHVIRETL